RNLRARARSVHAGRRTRRCRARSPSARGTEAQPRARSRYATCNRTAHRRHHSQPCPEKARGDELEESFGEACDTRHARGEEDDQGLTNTHDAPDPVDPPYEGPATAPQGPSARSATYTAAAASSSSATAATAAAATAGRGSSTLGRHDDVRRDLPRHGQERDRSQW